MKTFRKNYFRYFCHRPHVIKESRDTGEYFEKEHIKSDVTIRSYANKAASQVPIVRCPFVSVNYAN